AVGAGSQILETSVGKAAGLIGHAHRFVERQAGVRCIEQSVFLRAIEGHLVGPAHAGVHEFDDHFLANTFNVTVAPVFKGESRGLAAAFVDRPVIGSARRMGVNFVGLAVHDVNPPAIGLPPRNSRGKVLVGICDARVVLFFVLVLFGIRGGIAALPESLDKVVALFVVRKLLESGSLFVGDDPDYVLIQPLLIGLAKFDVEIFFLLFLLLFRERAFQRVDLIAGLPLGSSHSRARIGRSGAVRLVILGLGSPDKSGGHGQDRDRNHRS